MEQPEESLEVNLFLVVAGGPNVIGTQPKHRPCPKPSEAFTQQKSQAFSFVSSILKPPF